MRKNIVLVGIGIFLVLSFAPSLAHAQKAQNVQDAVWADGRLYGTTLTPTNVPAKGPFDVILNFAGSGLDGQRSVSDSKPGDSDYNGGRWAVYMVTFTSQGMTIHDPDGDGKVNFELMSYEQVLEHRDLGHLTIGSEAVRYFLCPLHP